MPKNKTLARGVALVGAGMSKFGAFPEKSSRDLFVEAFKSMRQSVDKDFPASHYTAAPGSKPGQRLHPDWPAGLYWAI